MIKRKTLGNLILVFLLSLFTLVIFADPVSERAIPVRILMEQADSLSDLDGERALQMTHQIECRLGEDNDSLLAELRLIRGNAYFSLGRYSEAQDCLDKAMVRAESLQNPYQLARIHAGQGVISRIEGELEDALMHYQKALHFLKSIDKPEEEANVLMSLAILYHHTGRLEDSESFARQAYEKAKFCRDEATLIYVINNFGTILYQNGKKKHGLALIHQAIVLAEKQKSVKYLLKVYTSMLGLFYIEEVPDSVDYYMRKAGEQLTQVPPGSVEAVSFMQQSAIILAKYGRYELSNELWHKILKLPSASHFIPEHRVCQLMAHNFKELHDYNQMEAMYDRSIALVDSLRASTIDRELSDFNVKYGTAQKELRIAKVESEKANLLFSRMLFISVTVLCMIILIAIFYIHDRQRRRGEELQRVRERLEGIEQERARLAKDLHDGVCNDLLGVGYMLQMEGCNRNEIFHQIESIRDEVRTLSHNLLPPRFHSLNIDQLFRAMEQKMTDFIHYRSENDGPWEMVTEDVAYQLYRIVQELISNVRKHTTAESMEIDMVLCQKELHLDLSHQGQNKDMASSLTKGIGLETTRRRLMLIGANMIHLDKDEYKEVRIALKL